MQLFKRCVCIEVKRVLSDEFEEGKRFHEGTEHFPWVIVKHECRVGEEEVRLLDLKDVHHDFALTNPVWNHDILGSRCCKVYEIL